MRRLVLVAALVVALPLSAHEGLRDLARVWAAVKYLHPQSLQRDLDLDGMLVRSIPKVRAAKTEDEVAAAIAAMLAELGDPATRITAAHKPTGVSIPIVSRAGDTLVIHLGPFADAAGDDSVYGQRQTLAKEIAGAKAIVIDLRAKGTDPSWVLPYLDGLIVDPVGALPGRGVFHSGYAPQQGTTSGGYYSAIQILPEGGMTVGFSPPKAAPRIVFVTSGDILSFETAALWWNGKAAIVSEKPVSETAVARVESREVGMAHSARIRVRELAASGLVADAVVPPGLDDATLKKAIELASATTPWKERPPVVPTAVAPRNIVEKPYAQMEYPETAYRLLALIRCWTIIDTFYPYKHLIGDWDAVLTEFEPRFADAADATEYAAAVLELVARVEDGHSGAWGHPAISKLVGDWWLPADIRYVEGAYVVTSRRGNFPEGVPLNVGDVVVSIDGEPIEARVARLWKYRTASTEAARRNRVAATAVRGPKDSVAEIGVRQPDGSTRLVRVPRVGTYVPPVAAGLPYRVLEGNIGYVDLTRLTPPEVDAMFDALMKTRAIVFDMRGYPNGTAWPIAPRINTRKAKYAAVFRRVQLPREGDASGLYFEQELPKSDKPVYQGATVMLIDDQAISQSEHTGLFFEAANGTKFIGTNSSGANGDVTTFPLPGGFTVLFTGHDVRHADGRQLQRIGLVPDVRVEPTIRGIREGKDEVLERAIAYIVNGK